MKKTRYFIAAAALCVGFGAVRVQAQTEAQKVTFSIICQYVTNVLATNADEHVIENHRVVLTVLLNSANIARAIAIDLNGTNWNKPYVAAGIFREVNLITGHEALFLRDGTNQIQISSNTDGHTNFFNFSLTSNEPPYDVTNYSPAITPLTNVNYEVTNYFPVANPHTASLPILGGRTYTDTNSGAMITTNTSVDGLYSLSFTSYNLQFNIFGNGQGTVSLAGGSINGTTYELPALATEITGAGTFNLNVSTNVFFNTNPSNPPIFFTGVAHGTVVIGSPIFLAIPGP